MVPAEAIEPPEKLLMTEAVPDPLWVWESTVWACAPLASALTFVSTLCVALETLTVWLWAETVCDPEIPPAGVYAMVFNDAPETLPEIVAAVPVNLGVTLNAPSSPVTPEDETLVFCPVDVADLLYVPLNVAAEVVWPPEELIEIPLVLVLDVSCPLSVVM